MANVNSPRTQRSTVKSRHTDRTNPKRSTTPRQSAMVSVIAATPVVTVTSHEHHDIHEAVDTPAGHNHEYPNTGGLQPCVTGACYPPSLTRCSPATPRRLRVGRATSAASNPHSDCGRVPAPGVGRPRKVATPRFADCQDPSSWRFNSSKSALRHRHSGGADHHCGIRQIIRATKDHHERTVVPSRLSSIRSALTCHSRSGWVDHRHRLPHTLQPGGGSTST